MTMERISLIFDPSAMLLSSQMVLSLLIAVVVCAILASISGFDPSSETMAPTYLKLLTIDSFRPLTWMSGDGSSASD